MPGILTSFGIKDYVIAGLASLCLLLVLNTYLDVHLGPVGFSGWKPTAEANEQGWSNEKAAHAVTTASLNLLQEKLATYIKDGERRSKDAQKALEAQQERSAALDKQIDRIRSVRASAPVAAGKCETPDVVLSSEGL